MSKPPRIAVLNGLALDPRALRRPQNLGIAALPYAKAARGVFHGPDINGHAPAPQGLAGIMENGA